LKTIQLIDGMDYPEDIPEPKPEAHLITAEIMSRLQELDEIDCGNTSLAPAGIRLVNRLAAIERKSRRAYRLVLDMVGQQDSFSQSLEQLASRHLNADGDPTSRQSWLQNAQADVETIKMIWPEVGNIIGELLKRRGE
jgi:hypothetical protein